MNIDLSNNMYLKVQELLKSLRLQMFVIKINYLRKVIRSILKVSKQRRIIRTPPLKKSTTTESNYAK